jgi:hypothetical protein
LTLASPSLQEGLNNNVTVATFSDGNSTPVLSQFQAVIHWGDGFVSTASAAAGTITQTGSTFNILGSHAYKAPGQQPLPFSVQVSDFGPATAPATSVQVTSGGPANSAYQLGTHTLTRGVFVAHLSNLAAPGGVYNPATAGALTSLSYSFAFRVFSSTGGTSDQVGVGLLVKQGENYYYADYHGVGQNGLWNSAGTTLTAASFTRIFGSGPAHPDFSAAGAPLEFGYCTANSTTGLETLTWGLANFRIVLNGTTYNDSTFNNSDWTQLILASDNLGAATAVKSASLTLTDAPLTLTLNAPNPVVNTPLTSVKVATFTDADSTAQASNFQAVIHWGDGFVSTASSADGTITQTGSTFNIFGSHTYTQPGALTFSVQVFDFAAPSLTPATAVQVTSGGPANAAYQFGTHTLTRGVFVAHLSNLAASAGVYNPASAGALTSLSYSFNFRVFSSTGGTSDQVGVGLLVKQGETYYFAGYHGVSQNGLWNSSGATLTAASFTRVFGSGPAHPDFSAAGAPLEFGYCTANSTTGLETLTWGLANFSVVLNGTTYNDTTFNNSDWTQLILASDNLGAAKDSKSSSISVSP